MRLIDADVLLEHIKKLKCHAENKKYEQGLNDCLQFYFPQIIDKQPTAYDVEKVVEELKNMKTICGAGTIVGGDYIHRNDAIEILKQGGVSDDVCEWRLCDEEANVYDTSCRNPHILIEGTPKENNYEYCPYCGKKIKVVE